MSSSSPHRTTHRFHHVGYVVASIDASIEAFCKSLGGSGWTETWADPIQNVRVAFVNPRCAGDPSVELVEPADDRSPAYRFLQGGGGIHHICYEVDDLDRELRDAVARGVTIIRRPQPAVAFGGRRIAWTSAGKLLVEYLEAAEAVPDPIARTTPS